MKKQVKGIKVGQIIIKYYYNIYINLTQINTELIETRHHDEVDLCNFLPLLLDKIDNFNPGNFGQELIAIQYYIREIATRNHSLKSKGYYGLDDLVGKMNLSVDLLIMLGNSLLTGKHEHLFEIGAKYFSITLKLKYYSARAREVLSDSITEK